MNVPIDNVVEDNVTTVDASNDVEVHFIVPEVTFIDFDANEHVVIVVVLVPNANSVGFELNVIVPVISTTPDSILTLFPFELNVATVNFADVAVFNVVAALIFIVVHFIVPELRLIVLSAKLHVVTVMSLLDNANSVVPVANVNVVIVPTFPLI